MVLQWIQDHIVNFAGGYEKVTVIRVCAGPISAAAQIITPIDDRTLFHAVAMKAGVVACNGPNETTRKSFIRLKKIAVQVGCPVDSREMVDCLRDASFEDLLPLAVDTIAGTNHRES